MTTSTPFPPSVIRYGSAEPLAETRTLRAGPLSAVLENGALRFVTLSTPDGEVEVVRGVYVAIRDQNWATIPPRFTRYEVDDRGDSFTVSFTSEHVEREIDFTWDGRIEGPANGQITFTMDGRARSTFRRNRIGFCVLHPMEAAGTTVRIEHPDGRTEEGAFPVQISPHQPFFDIAAMRQSVNGAEVEIRFTGDIFETEDQRNWTDASYKTYCTPLALPYPVEVQAGTRVQQSVTVRVLGAGGGAEAVARGLVPRSAPAGGTPALPDQQPSHAEGRTAGDEPLPYGRDHQNALVHVGHDPIGPLPPLGLGIASHGQPLTASETDLLRRLGLAHLHATLHLTSPQWEAQLRRAAAESHALGAALQIEAVCGDTGAGIDALAAALATQPNVRVVRVLVFPTTGVVTTEPVMRRAREVFRAARLDVPLGGGSRADFVNVNRAEQLPVQEMDVLAYAINPQVHAFDNTSLVETLAAQAVTVENARRIAGGKPVAVGPVTLRQRLNPAATAAEPEPPPGELPLRVDPRQMSLFCAGWTVGSIRRLAAAGAAALTYFETTGRLGVLERTEGWSAHPRFHSRPGMRYPVYYVFAAIADVLSEGSAPQVLPVDTAPALAVEALALRAGNRTLLLVANLLNQPQTIRLGAAVPGSATVQGLDEESAQPDSAGADGSWPGRTATLGATVGGGILDLRPYTLAAIRY